jgi:predicted Rossmann-fold nucleotide-binding protein
MDWNGIVVDSMHERETKMNDLCDGVINFVRGFEPLKSFWNAYLAQLDFTKPIAVLNTNGFYDALLCCIWDNEERLLKEVNYQMF